MREPLTPEALDRCLDALALHEEMECDAELAAVARRYLALGQAVAPPGARERVRQHVARQAGPCRNGHQAAQVAPLRQIALARAGDAPGPEILRQTGPVAHPRRPALPRYAWPALLLLLIGLVAAVAWTQAPFPAARVLVAPVTEATQPPAPTPPATAGQTLFMVELPAGALPVAAYGATFDQRTMPGRLESTEASQGPILLRFIVSGEVQAQADATLKVWSVDRAGDWRSVPAETVQTLTAGDAILLRGSARLTWVNTGAEPVEMIAWAMTDLGGGNSTVPPGWRLHDSAAVHMAVLDHPAQETQLVLRRRELAPGAEIGPPPGAWLSQFVALDHNAAGLRVAPMFGRLADGVRRNAGRQDLTSYQVSLGPLAIPEPAP